MTIAARVVPRAVAAGLCCALFVAARPMGTGAGTRAQLAAGFAFTDLGWPEPDEPTAEIRVVNPSLERISAWISTVGAGVALGDVDGDGLANDACAVDPRTDTVTVSGVPGTPARYEAFELTAGALRYDDTMAPMGCVLGDVNEDGSTDALVYYWGRSPIVFLHRPSATLMASEGAFTASELERSVPRWFTNAALLTDLDGDGHLDVLVANYFTDGARILDARRDTNEQMQTSMSRAFNGGGTHFFLGEPRAAGVTFRSVESGLSHDELHGWTLALGAHDFDGDLLPEIYVANDFGPDRLLVNRSTPGRLRFATAVGRRHLYDASLARVLGQDSFKGMGVDFGDLDGDGVTDIFVSNITDEYALHESNFAFVGTGNTAAMAQGRAPFDDHSEQLGLARSGWAWDVKLADFDNDGRDEVVQATGFLEGDANRWPELHELAMANDGLLRHPAWWPRFGPGDDLSGGEGVQFFVHDGRRFVEIGSDVGVGRPTVSRGIGVGDVDGDGDLDLAVANQWGRFSLYRNDCPDCGSSLGLRIRRTTVGQPGAAIADPTVAAAAGTTSAPGATVTVVLPDGRRLTQAVDGGSGHSGRRSDELHFGLGDVTDPVRVEVTWRDVSGAVRHASLSVGSGRHTVVLGQT